MRIWCQNCKKIQRARFTYTVTDRIIDNLKHTCCSTESVWCVSIKCDRCLWNVHSRTWKMGFPCEPPDLRWDEDGSKAESAIGDEEERLARDLFGDAARAAGNKTE